MVCCYVSGIWEALTRWAFVWETLTYVQVAFDCRLSNFISCRVVLCLWVSVVCSNSQIRIKLLFWPSRWADQRRLRQPNALTDDELFCFNSDSPSELTLCNDLNTISALCEHLSQYTANVNCRKYSHFVAMLLSVKCPAVGKTRRRRIH